MMAGLFGAFSTFLMKALGSLDAADGARAMQAINEKIVRPAFLIVFFGTPLAALLALWFKEDNAGDAWIWAGAGTYFVACLLSTVLFNVPLNNRLDAVDPDTDEGKALWQHYLVRWTCWNHVRSVATVVSTPLLSMGLLQSGGYLAGN